jgi:hypothetical protein
MKCLVFVRQRVTTTRPELAQPECEKRLIYKGLLLVPQRKISALRRTFPLPRGLATRAGAALGIIPFGTTAEA